MIRRSSIVAVIALLLSLVLHVVGLGFAWRVEAPPQASPGGDETTTEIVAPGSTFEDIAEPAKPEPAAEPEPPVEADPVPEIDVPTSDAQIASDTPQQDTTPDTGNTAAVEPETTGPAEPQAGDTPQPETIEPAGQEPGDAPDPTLTPPPGTDTITAIPLGQPDVPVDPAETPEQPPEESTTATAPAAAVPIPPVTVAPVAPSEPIVSLEPSETEPAAPVVTVAPTPEQSEDTADADTSELTVTSSLRPRLPTKRPAPQPQGASNGSFRAPTAQRAPAPRIESPLTAFRRNGTNLFGGQGGGVRSGGQGFSNSRSGGNASATNYAGQVLAHLNRTASVPVNDSGWARVFFEVNANGSLASVRIGDNSGSQEINRAARQQVRSAVPFPRPPGGRSETLNFFYQIR